MAAPQNKSSQYHQITDAHSVELLNKAKAADDAYQALVTYDFGGTGVLSAHTWTDPTGHVYDFTTGSGEIRWDGTFYSNLNPSDKKLFFVYLRKFIVECMKRYDVDYNL